MTNISQNVNIEMLEKLSDGTYKKKHPETKELEFSYPDPNEEEPQEPVYQAPLSEEVKELKARQDSTEDALLTLLMTI